MDQIWLASPSPAIRLGPEVNDGSWRVNPAARAWADGRGLSADLWPSIAAELRAALPQALRGRLSALPLRWQAVVLEDGWLVWLCPAGPTDAPAPWRSAADKLALVQEFVTIGVFERDLRTLEARWDAHMFELLGIDAASGTPRFDAAAEAVHPDDREHFWAEHTRFVREGGRHSMRYRIIRPDGSVHDLQSLVDVRLDTDGTPLTMIGVIVDDTEGAGRVRAQVAITAYLERALHLAKVSVWRIDYATRRIHFNDVGYELIGLTPSPEGMDIDELRSLAHPDDTPKLLRAAETAAAGSDVIDVEVRYRDPGGQYRPLLTRRVAERNERGEVIGLLGITDRKSVV